MPIQAVLIALLTATAPEPEPEPEPTADTITADAPDPGGPTPTLVQPAPPQPAPPQPAPPQPEPAEAPAVDSAPDPAPVVPHARPAWDRSLASADWLHDDTRDPILMQRSHGALMTGLGLTLGIVGPVLITQPRNAFALLRDSDGISIDVAAVPLSTGLVLGLGGGALSFIGARTLSRVYLDRSLEGSGVGQRKIQERRRNIRVLAGVGLGIAGAVLVAGVADGAIAGAKWTDVVNRDPSPLDEVDGRDVALRASRSLALATALPSLVGFSVGLLMGRSARGETARLVPTGSGMALRGRF